MRSSPTRAIILAAGEGQRLRPLTLETPKAMLSLGGVPVLERLVRHLTHHGAHEIAINLHHAPGVIVHYFGSGTAWGVRITYSYEPRILGTAGAVRKLKDFVSETTFIIYGDLVTDLDLTELATFHRQHGGPMTVALYEAPNPWECGVVELDGESRIVRFVEKPPRDQVFSNLANAGVYVMEPEVVRYVPPDTFYDFGHHLFPDLLDRGVEIRGYVTEATILDIGTFASYRRAEELVKGGLS